MKILKISRENQQEEFTSINFNNEKIKLLKYGENYFIIVTQNNNVFVYGSNDYGEIGLGEEKKVDELVKIDYLKFGNIKFVECGDKFTIIVNDLNEFYFTGVIGTLTESQTFKLVPNLTFKENTIKEIISGHQILFILTNDNLLYGFGDNSAGQLGLTKDIDECKTFTKISDLKVKEIKSGYQHSILLDFYGNVYSAGSNSFGELGLGNTNITKGFIKANLPFKVIKVFADMCSSFILSENYDLYAAGYNGEGQLGLGDINHRNEFTKIILENKFIDKIKVYHSFNEFCFLNINNDIYFTGKSEELYLFYSKGLTTFSKIDIKENNYKYIYPILLYSKIFLAFSDYGINGEGENNLLSLKLFERLNNNQLNDLQFIV